MAKTRLEAGRRWLTAPRRRTALAVAWFALVVALALELGVLSVLNREVYRGGVMSFVVLATAAPAWAAVGAVIVSRTGNLVGWILMAVATVMVGSPAAEQYIVYGVLTSPGSLPFVEIAARIGSATMVLLWGIGLLFLVFPTGRPLSPKWRLVMWAIMVGAVVHGLGWVVRLDDQGRAVLQGPWTDRGVALENGLAIPALSWVWEVGVAVALLASGAGIASLVIRVRRSHGEERAQLRWLSYVGILVALAFLAGILLPALRDSDATFLVMFFCIVFGIPAACGIAILRYHLYDIDLVISKTIVYTLLAVFIGAVYVAIVVGASAVVPIGADSPLLSIAATGVVALTFQPARDRVQRFANRIVYGHRSTPYEVLTRFSDRVGNTYATDDVLPRTARVIAEGVNAERATIWLHLADELRPAAGWPDVDPAASSRELEDDVLPEVPGEHVAEIRYRGDLLGAIAIDKRRGDPLNPGEIRLIDDLAAQAGLVVSNVRLTADLEARLEVITRQAAELRASRQRIVAAQDEERRRLERNIHDGAQQHLVALAVKLRLARGLLSRDPEKARTMLRETAGQVDEALETLHALALGIYPPRLEADGVAAALMARYGSSDLPVRFHADGIGRYPLDTEAAVYFCVLEALQNAAKYATARSIDVTFGERNGALTFEVVDDGVGFDAAAGRNGTGLDGMRDRLAVFGGDVTLTSAPGRGTIVRGQVPLASGVPA